MDKCKIFNSKVGLLELLIKLLWCIIRDRHSRWSLGFRFARLDGYWCHPLRQEIKEEGRFDGKDYKFCYSFRLLHEISDRKLTHSLELWRELSVGETNLQAMWMIIKVMCMDWIISEERREWREKMLILFKKKADWYKTCNLIKVNFT